MVAHPEPARSDRGKDCPRTGPVSEVYLRFHLRHHGISIDRIHEDRIIHEALTVGPDPLHLALVFNLSISAASRYAAIAQTLLGGELEQHAADQ